MARRSILNKNASPDLTQREARVGDYFDESWLVFTHINERVIDYSDFYYRFGIPSGIRIPQRIEFVRKIGRAIYLALSDKRSIYTYTGDYYRFRKYIAWCDNNDFPPFSKEGYLGYVGDDGELRRLVSQNNERRRFLYDYDDGDEVGISEKSAQDINSTIRKLLKLSGVYKASWDLEYDSFKENDRCLTIPYSSDETKKTTKILSDVFEALFVLLKDHYSIHGANVPQCLSVDIPSLGVIAFDGNIRQSESPLNILMLSGYALFSYYTALNQGVILKAAHPVIIDKRKFRDKTIKMISLSLWKTRSGKFVSSELTDEVHDVSDNEFDVEIEKRTGVNLVEKLVALADMYSTTKKGKPLFWNVTKNGTIKNFDVGWMYQLAEKLNIKPDDTTACNHIFAAALLLAIQGSYFNIKLVVSDEGLRLISKKLTTISASKVQKEICSCAIGLISSYNAPESFYRATLPLIYTRTEEGTCVTFNDNSENGSFFIPTEYEKIIKNLELWSSSLNENTGRYLLPFPEKNCGPRKFKWSNPKVPPPLNETMRLLGLAHGDYYLEINSRRFRAFTAEMLYSDEDMGADGSLILDNNLDTFDIAYSGGNPEFNQLILSQALDVVALIFKGLNKKDAKDKIRQSLGRDVLAFDKLIADKMHFNQNGFACKGQSDIDKEMASDFHRSAARRAEKLGVGDADSIPCYQLDQCCYCKNAKMVDDVNQTYKMLSFVEVLKSKADQKPEDEDTLLQKVHYLMLLINENIPQGTIREAQKCLLLEGIHPLVRSMDIAELVI